MESGWWQATQGDWSLVKLGGRGLCLFWGSFSWASGVQSQVWSVSVTGQSSSGVSAGWHPSRLHYSWLCGSQTWGSAPSRDFQFRWASFKTFLSRFSWEAGFCCLQLRTTSNHVVRRKHKVVMKSLVFGIRLTWVWDLTQWLTVGHWTADQISLNLCPLTDKIKPTTPGCSED